MLTSGWRDQHIHTAATHVGHRTVRGILVSCCLGGLALCTQKPQPAPGPAVTLAAAVLSHLPASCARGLPGQMPLEDATQAPQWLHRKRPHRPWEVLGAAGRKVLDPRCPVPSEQFDASGQRPPAWERVQLEEGTRVLSICAQGRGSEV